MIETSPWGYLAKYTSQLEPKGRGAAREELAGLRLPDLFLVLTTSGIEVASRLSPGDSPAQGALAHTALQ